jgi:parallel beta-helix repeat protein
MVRNKFLLMFISLCLIILLTSSIHADNVYTISGQESLDSEITLNPLILLGPEEAYPESFYGTGYTASFYSEGILIKEANFSMISAFSFQSIVPENTTSITFTDSSLDIITEFIITPNSPLVSNLIIQENGDNYDLSWSLSDDDGDNLVSDLYYSLNGGPWEILALNMHETTYTIPTYFFYQGEISVKVVATDSFNTGEAISAPFISNSQNKIPILAIEFPVIEENESLHFSEDEEIFFSAVAYDLEDGGLDNFVWESNIDGIISTEDSFSTENLSIGNHIITVSTTDGEHIVTETIGFNISEIEKLPLTSCKIINEPGHYILQNDVTTSEFPGSICFQIDSDNVILDLNGHKIEGNEDYVGVYVRRWYEKALIKNGNISGFEWGVSLEGDYNRVENMEFHTNNVAIYVANSYGNKLTNNLIYSNGKIDQIGRLGPGPGGISLFMSHKNTIENNVLIDNAYPIGLMFSENNLFRNNSIEGCRITESQYFRGCITLLSSSENEFYDSNVENSNVGLLYLYENSQDNLFKNVQFVNSGVFDVYLNLLSMGNSFLSSSYDYSKEWIDTWAGLVRQWNYEVHVEDEFGTSIENSTIEIIKNGNEAIFLNTDSEGNLNTILDSYYSNGTRSYNNYTIIASHINYESQTHIFQEINENIQDVFILSPFPSPPAYSVTGEVIAENVKMEKVKKDKQNKDRKEKVKMEKETYHSVEKESSRMKWAIDKSMFGFPRFLSFSKK